MPTPPSEPAVFKIVLVDYDKAPKPVDFREPVLLIAHDAGPACNYTKGLSPDQARQLFTVGEIEILLPGPCSVIELSYRALTTVPTMDCEPGVELCSREEILTFSLYLTLEGGSSYLSTSWATLPAEGLPDAGSSPPEGTRLGLLWLSMPAFAGLGLIVLALRRRSSS